MTTGTLYGIHAEQSSQTVNLVQRAKNAGVRYAAVIPVHNPGLCVDVKQIEPGRRSWTRQIDSRQLMSLAACTPSGWQSPEALRGHPNMLRWWPSRTPACLSG